MSGAEQRHRDLGHKRRDQELWPVDSDLAQPPDIATHEHGDRQRTSDDSEEEEH
jgi:hypothetical protein